MIFTRFPNTESGFLYGTGFFIHTNAEVNSMKEDEKKPSTWEAADPKPPVIQSGRMENRREH